MKTKQTHEINTFKSTPMWIQFWKRTIARITHNGKPWNKKSSISLVYFLAFATVIILQSFTAKKRLLIEGAWSIVEVQMVNANGTHTSTFPKESLAIFSNRNYSFCWTSQFAGNHSWQIADREKLDRFNQSIVNTGSFELKDSILTTNAIFAMHPMFTNGQAKFKCSFSGDTLVLKGLNVLSKGNIPHPVYANGAHFVNKLVKNQK